MANASNATPAVIAARIVDAVGGPANITSLTHCATRLHFELPMPAMSTSTVLNPSPESSVHSREPAIVIRSSSAERSPRCTSRSFGCGRRD